jgi:DNA-3-methyladenine glycosylase
MNFVGDSSDPERGGVKPGFWARHPVEVAQDLIGARLTVEGVGGRIVETEAYHHEEPASHSFRGPRPRNAAMYGPVGHVYVYRIYGAHWCLNLVCGEAPGSAVLIRALEPEQGQATMAERRGTDDPRALCSGPGKLCQALAVTKVHDGLAADHPPFALSRDDVAYSIAVGPRIGITKAADLPWRFGLAGSKFLSRPFPRI